MSLPNIYKSSAIVASTSNASGISSISSQYAGLASLAGVSLPGSNETNKISIGIETLKSFSFFKNFVIKHDLLIPLIASKGFDEATQTLIIDDEFYNVKDKKWVSDVKYSINGKPSLQYSYREFSKNLSIDEDKKNGLVTISFQHYSPLLSKNIVEMLIKDINDINRNEQIAQSKNSIEFLEMEIEGTQLTEVRSGLYSLIQKQVETMMLANATPEFLFKTVSSPISPEIKSGPSRIIIVILAFMGGFFLSCSYIIFRSHLLIKD